MERGMAEGENLRSLARIAILLLCLGAAVVLVMIFTSSPPEYGKALQSAVFVAFVSLPIGAGINLVARQPGIAAFGYLTILVGLVALLLSADMVWLQGLSIEGSTNLERWVVYTLIGALATGIASMLLAGHEDSDADSIKLVRGMTVLALFGLLVAVIEEIRVSGDRVDPYLLGALSVFFVLGMLVLPLLRIATAERGA
jgi:hypothetical protein